MMRTDHRCRGSGEPVPTERGQLHSERLAYQEACLPTSRTLTAHNPSLHVRLGSTICVTSGLAEDCCTRRATESDEPRYFDIRLLSCAGHGYGTEDVHHLSIPIRFVFDHSHVLYVHKVHAPDSTLVSAECVDDTSLTSTRIRQSHEGRNALELGTRVRNPYTDDRQLSAVNETKWTTTLIQVEASRG